MLLQATIRLLFAVRSRFRAGFRNPLHFHEGIARVAMTVGWAVPFCMVASVSDRFDRSAPFTLLAGSVRLTPLVSLLLFSTLLAPRNCSLRKDGPSSLSSKDEILDRCLMTIVWDIPSRRPISRTPS